MSARDFAIGDLILTRMLAEARKELGSSPISSPASTPPKIKTTKATGGIVGPSGIIGPSPTAGAWSMTVSKRFGLYEAKVYNPDGKLIKTSDFFFKRENAQKWGEKTMKFCINKSTIAAVKSAGRTRR